MEAADVTAKILREEIALVGPPGPSRRYPSDLKARVVAWAEPLIIAGRGKLEVADAIGVPWESLSRWIREKALAPRAAAQPPPARHAEMKSVRIVDAPAARPRAPLSVRSPKGFIVEGLDLETAVALLTRLG